MKRKTFLFISTGVVAVVAAALTVVFVFAFNKKGEETNSGVPAPEIVEFNPSYLQSDMHIDDSYSFTATKPYYSYFYYMVRFSTLSQNASIGSYQLHDYLFAAKDDVIIQIGKESFSPVLNFKVELEVVTCDSNGENLVTHSNSEFTFEPDSQIGYATSIEGTGWIYIHTVRVTYIYL